MSQCESKELRQSGEWAHLFQGIRQLEQERQVKTFPRMHNIGKPCLGALRRVLDFKSFESKRVALLSREGREHDTGGGLSWQQRLLGAVYIITQHS